MKKEKLKLGFGLFMLFAVLTLGISMIGENVITKVGHGLGADTIVLDPGHGGIDGGAEGSRGICEKDINLAISKQVKLLAEADGWRVVMTREEDRGLYTDVTGDGTEDMKIQGKRSIRSLKTEDLLARRKLVEKVEPVLAVSIHLNSYKQDRSVRGAQTFYPSGGAEEQILADSKRLAELIQEQLVAGMQDGTDRVALGKRDVLLFKKVSAPIVIVECGFLSNGEEEKLLQKEDYQKKLAASIYEGIKKYSGKEGKKPPKIVMSN